MDIQSRAKAFQVNGVHPNSDGANGPKFDELNNLVDYLSKIKDPRKDIPIVLGMYSHHLMQRLLTSKI